MNLGMTVTEAAEAWDVSVETVRRWCRQGRVEARRVGRDWLILSTSAPSIPLGRPKSAESQQ